MDLSMGTGPTYPCGGCLALREENARLKADVLYEQDRNRNNVTQYSAEVERLTTALVGTVAQVEQQRKRAERAEAEVARLATEALAEEANRIRAAKLECAGGHDGMGCDAGCVTAKGE